MLKTVFVTTIFLGSYTLMAQPNQQCRDLITSSCDLEFSTLREASRSERKELIFQCLKSKSESECFEFADEAR